MTLVERGEELELLGSLITHGGKGSVAVVSGAVACGKTTLLNELADRAAKMDVITMFATGSRAERDLPFGVLGQFSQLMPTLDDAVVRAIEVGAVDVDPMPIARAVGAAVLAEARQAPVLLVVDDAQHCDEQSRLCLLYLIRRLHSAAVTVVLADGPERMATEFQAELLRQPRCHRVAVGPLSPGAVDELLGSNLNTGGNPLIVSTLANNGNYRQAVLDCLHRGGPLMLSVANGLAVLGDCASTEMLAKLCGTDSEQVVTAREALLACGLPTGEELRAIVLTGMSSTVTTRLRWRAAELLRAEGASCTEVARQLLAAPDARESWAAEVLTEAAEVALRVENLAFAAECLELAERCCPESADRQCAAIVALLARVSWRLDPAGNTTHLSSLAAAVHDGWLTGSAPVNLVSYLLWHGRHDEAVRCIRRLAEERQNGGRIAGEARLIGLWLATTHPALLSRVPVELRPPAGWLANLKSVTFDQRLQSAATLAQVITGRADDSAALGAEHVLQRSRLGERALESPFYEFSALLALVYTGRLKAATYWCERSLTDTPDTAGATGRALMSCVRAEIAMRQGDLPAAYDYAKAAMRLLPAASWGVAVGLPLSILLLSLTGMGRVQEAIEHANQPMPEAMFQTRYGLSYLYARGQLSMAVGRPHAALADFLSCGDLMQEWSIDQPAVVPWRTGAAQAWLELRHPGKARRLTETQLSMVGSRQPRIRGISLRILATASDTPTRPHLLNEAVDLLEACGDKFELSRALADLGDRPRLREADGPKVRAGGIAILSEAERRVAGPAAQGFTNREIAGKLFITVSTVEQHLTRVYRKLNVKHRRELPAELCAS